MTAEHAQKNRKGNLTGTILILFILLLIVSLVFCTPSPDDTIITPQESHVFQIYNYSNYPLILKIYRGDISFISSSFTLEANSGVHQFRLFASNSEDPFGVVSYSSILNTEQLAFTVQHISSTEPLEFTDIKTLGPIIAYTSPLRYNRLIVNNR